jgi:Multiubiquitin
MSHIDENQKHVVRIHIDRQPYESSTPTTGIALYALAGVAEHRELFREASGDQEDELIERSATSVRLEQDEHFYSQKEFTLIVNGQRKLWAEPKISFEQITHLAFPDPAPPNIVITYTVEYEDGPRRNREGSMTAGKSVYVKNEMIFHVTETGRS